eukprot:363783-Chlamydomonas_euryale.AAC.2
MWVAGGRHCFVSVAGRFCECGRTVYRPAVLNIVRHATCEGHGSCGKSAVCRPVTASGLWIARTSVLIRFTFGVMPQLAFGLSARVALKVLLDLACDTFFSASTSGLKVAAAPGMRRMRTSGLKDAAAPGMRRMHTSGLKDAAAPGMRRMHTSGLKDAAASGMRRMHSIVAATGHGVPLQLFCGKSPYLA